MLRYERRPSYRFSTQAITGGAGGADIADRCLRRTRYPDSPNADIPKRCLRHPGNHVCATHGYVKNS
jgi:hypothetical protein